MAAKSDPAPKKNEPAAESAEEADSIEIPAEVTAALGGLPLPPPPMPSQRMSVSRVGEGLRRPRRAGGGLLAPTRPERREALAKVERARHALAAMVEALEPHLAAAGAAVKAAGADAETCEAEGFDAARAASLVDGLATTLDEHLGA